MVVARPKTKAAVKLGTGPHQRGSPSASNNKPRTGPHRRKNSKGPLIAVAVVVLAIAVAVLVWYVKFG